MLMRFDVGIGIDFGAAEDFLSLIDFGLDKESLFPIPFYCILVSTQLRPVSIVADIVE